jgi:hypothetical protein
VPVEPPEQIDTAPLSDVPEIALKDLERTPAERRRIYVALHLKLSLS